MLRLTNIRDWKYFKMLEAAISIDDILDSNNLIIVRDLKKKEIKLVLYDIKKDEILGYITAFRSDKGMWQIDRSATNKGYGPFMYDSLLMEINPESIQPSHLIKPQALNIWNYYFNNRKDVNKKEIDPNSVNYADFYKEDDSMESPKLKNTDNLKLINTLYSKNITGDYVHFINTSEAIIKRNNINKNKILKKALDYFYSKYWTLQDSYNINESNDNKILKIIDTIKKQLLEDNEYQSWEDFIDSQNLGDCQSIINNIKNMNIDGVKAIFGEIEILYPNDKKYYNKIMTHHWIEIYGQIYEFSKGTLIDYVDWNDKYSVIDDGEIEYINQISIKESLNIDNDIYLLKKNNEYCLTTKNKILAYADLSYNGEYYIFDKIYGPGYGYLMHKLVLMSVYPKYVRPSASSKPKVIDIWKRLKDESDVIQAIDKYDHYDDFYNKKQTKDLDIINNMYRIKPDRDYMNLLEKSKKFTEKMSDIVKYYVTKRLKIARELFLSSYI